MATVASLFAPTGSSAVKQRVACRCRLLFAASLLKNNKAAHEALMSAMSQKANVLECIEEIENVSNAS
jgi:hypothetical protein